MTRIHLIPTENRTQLRCVWRCTGDPARPMACRWIASIVTEEERTAPGDPAAALCSAKTTSDR